MKEMSQSKLMKYEVVALGVTIIVAAFYVTGLYKNILEIKKLKKEL